MNNLKVSRPAWGKPLRIPSGLAASVQDLADRTNLPFAFVAAELIRHSIDDAPDWMRVRERDERRRAVVREEVSA